MLLTVKGVVLREKAFGEYDKFIDVLTDSIGVVEISVKGARKNNGKNLSSTQLFSYAIFCVRKSGERYTLNSAEPISIFYGLRQEVKRFALACYFSELLRYVTPSEEPSDVLLRLTLNSFYYLSQGGRSVCLLKSIFELRLLSEIGLMPAIAACHVCIRYIDDPMYLVIDNGLLFCSECYEGRKDQVAIRLTPSLLHAVRHIVLVEMENLWSFKLSDQAEKQLGVLTERYLLCKLGREFKTLNFFKSTAMYNEENI